MSAVWRNWIAAMLAAVTFMASAGAAEQSELQGAGASAFVSADNEGFSTARLGAAYLPSYADADSLTGVRFTRHHFSQGSWRRAGQHLSFLHREIELATANGWQLEAGIFRQGGHDLLTLDGGWRKTLRPGTSVELFLSREWVETRRALEQGVHFTFGGASLEQQIGAHVTVIGVAAHQDFSDGNSREHGRFRFIYQPNLDLGLTLQWRYRAYRSARNDGSVSYFNPERYDERLFALGWRQRFAGWAGNLVLGTGQQRLAGTPHVPSHLLEFSLFSPPGRDHSLRLRGGFNQSASFNGPNYRYRYLQLEWLVGF